MKKGQFSEEQIIQILKESEAGVATGELCRQHGSRQRPSTNGNQNIEGWMCQT